MKPATLRLLIERARTSSEAAQALHARLRRSEDQARAHLEMLHQYVREYEDRGRCRTGDDRDPSADRNQAAFLARLQLAVDTQAAEVQSRVAAAAAAAGEVALCLRRRKSLETLDERRRAQEQRAAARRDQKNTDEFAQRAMERAATTGLQHDAAGAGKEP